MTKHSSKNGAGLLALCLVTLVSSTSFGQSVSVVRYSKEELEAAARPSFIKSSDLGDLLIGKFTMIAVALTNRQGGGNVAVRDVANSTAQKTKAQYMRGLATMTLDPNTPEKRADGDKLRVTLAQQTRKATEVKFKDAFPIFDRIRKGLTFHFDAKGTKATKPTSAFTPAIRYGLVETDIISGESPIAIASLGSIEEMGRGYSRQAKVVYTIDKLDDEQVNYKVFSQQSPEFDSANAEIGSEKPQDVNMWNRAPSSEVDLTIDAADSNAAVSDSLGQAKAPGARITLTQMDGFLSIQAVSSDLNKSRTMTLKAPLYRQMSLSRKMDSKFHATETAATNILGDSSLPTVNVVYAHGEKKIRGEMTMKNDRVNYTVTAEPRLGWGSNGDYKIKRIGDKISAGLSTSF
jgi:hypothetical protein